MTEMDPSGLRKAAEFNIEKSITFFAVAIAIEDNILDEEEAKRYLNMDPASRISSDLYPGDRAYDRAISIAREVCL